MAHENPFVRCHHCDGTGQIIPPWTWGRVRCPRCDGAGFLLKTELLDSDRRIYAARAGVPLTVRKSLGN